MTLNDFIASLKPGADIRISVAPDGAVRMYACKMRDDGSLACNASESTVTRESVAQASTFPLYEATLRMATSATGASDDNRR